MGLEFRSDPTCGGWGGVGAGGGRSRRAGQEQGIVVVVKVDPLSAPHFSHLQNGLCTEVPRKEKSRTCVKDSPGWLTNYNVHDGEELECWSSGAKLFCLIFSHPVPTSVFDKTSLQVSERFFWNIQTDGGFPWTQRLRISLGSFGGSPLCYNLPTWYFY